MRRGVAAVVMAVCLVSCGPPTSPSSGAIASSPSPAMPAALVHYFGSYSFAGGDIVVIARLGWYFEMTTGAYRTIYATASATRFTIGRRFQEPVPVFATLMFGAGSLTIAGQVGTRVGRRIDYGQSDVVIPVRGAQLAATITEPLSSAPHAGIVIVHGAERGEAYFYDVWVGVYASLGLAVLTYDKRGVGASTGVYPGEYPTDAALQTYADDAAAARDFLGHWPGVDARRVGLHGGSQGGWTVPLGMLRHPGAAFAVLVSAPATTVGQTDVWAGFSGGGEEMPAEPTDQMLAAVRATHDGYDPTPALRSLNVPVLWLLGDNDRTVPTAVCLEVIASLGKPIITVHVLPTGHALLVNPTGLLADDARSPGLAPDLVPTIRAWTAQTLAL